MRFLNFVGICLLATACAPITATPPGEPETSGTSNPFGQTQSAPGNNSAQGSALAKPESAAPDPVAESLEYLKQDKLGLALTKIDQALLDKPNDVQALNVAGMVYEQMGDVDTALVHLSNAVFAKPDDPYSRNNYGALLCRLGQHREAIEQFERASRAPGYDSPDVAFTNAGLCALKVPDIELAEKYFNRALHVNAKSPVALYQIAKISFLQKRFVAAREDLQHYLRVAPHTPKTLLLRAEIENSLGNDTARDAYAKRLIDLFPDSSEARLALALETPDALTRHLNASKNPEALPVAERVNCPQTESEGKQTAAAPAKPAVTAEPAKAKTERPSARATEVAVDESSQDGSEIKGAEWVLKQDADRYTVQLRAQRDRADLLKFARGSELGAHASYFGFPRDGDTWYALLYSDFDSLEEAELAAQTLLPSLKTAKPWVRRFGEIQALIPQETRPSETRTP